jgi:SHS2 domain-containing protein
MGSVETFDHTADLGMRVRAADLADLFRTAAEGLFDVILANREEVKAEQAETIRLTADSTAELLVVWLNELIFRCEAEHRFYGRFDVTVDPDGRGLEAVIQGEPIDHDRHVLDHEVKAATHHRMSLARDADGWAAEVILDI